jgi:hypothetical protein
MFAFPAKSADPSKSQFNSNLKPPDPLSAGDAKKLALLVSAMPTFIELPKGISIASRRQISDRRSRQATHQ